METLYLLAIFDNESPERTLCVLKCTGGLALTGELSTQQSNKTNNPIKRRIPGLFRGAFNDSASFCPFVPRRAI